MKNNVKIIISVISVVVVVFLVCFALWWVGTEKTKFAPGELELIQEELCNILNKGETIQPNVYTYNTSFKYYLKRIGFYNKYILLSKNMLSLYYLIHNEKNYLLLKKEKKKYIPIPITLKETTTQKEETTTQNPQETTPQEETTV